MEFIKAIYLINNKTKQVIGQIHPNSNFPVPVQAELLNIPANEFYYKVVFRVFNYSSMKIYIYVENTTEKAINL